MSIYNYSQNRHSDPVDASTNLTQRLNDLHVRSARSEAASLMKAQDTQFCVDCDDKIGAERKEAVPSAIRCAPCQEDHDREALLTSQRGRPD